MTELSAKDLIGLEPIGDGAYACLKTFDNGAPNIFGGQTLALALAAAQREAPDWPAHSLSGVFLRAGRVDQPVEFAVERLGDGRSFAVRRVRAIQAGRAIFEGCCSFHLPEAGVAHQEADAGGVAGPEGLADLAELARANAERLPPSVLALYTHPSPIEMRLAEPAGLFDRSGPPRRDFWMRIPTAAALADPRDHQALLALLSDYWLASSVGSVPPPAGFRAGFGILSLNHSFWFHAPARACGWLLYRTEISWAGQGRVLARGRMFDRDGRHVATATQELLLRGS
jgi:acyl-CoA thioesterase-2